MHDLFSTPFVLQDFFCHHLLCTIFFSLKRRKLCKGEKRMLSHKESTFIVGQKSFGVFLNFRFYIEHNSMSYKN